MLYYDVIYCEIIILVRSSTDRSKKYTQHFLYSYNVCLNEVQEYRANSKHQLLTYVKGSQPLLKKKTSIYRTTEKTKIKSGQAKWPIAQSLSRCQ